MFFKSRPIRMTDPAHEAWQPEYDHLWPSPTSEWLLRAALSGGQASADAFAHWKQAAGFANYDQIDNLSSRMLPMVYKQFKRSRISDAWMANLHALHRFQWANITTKQQRLVEIVQRLDAAGIPSLVLKGNALIAGGYFDDAGERPLHDLDLLIRPEDEREVNAALKSLNWTAGERGRNPESHARGWKDASGTELDLHLKLLPPPYPYMGLNDLLPFAQQAKLCGVTIRIPDATTLLMHCSAHGRLYWGGPTMPFLWVADTLRILERAPDGIDWQRLLSNSKRFSTLFAVRETLGYARAKFAAPVPDQWLRKARCVPLTKAELVPFFRWVGQIHDRSLLEFVDYIQGDFICKEQMLGREPSRLRFLHYVAQRALRLARWRRLGYRRARGLIEKALSEGPRAAIARPDCFQFVANNQPAASNVLRPAA